QKAGSELRMLSSKDGGVLLFNAHLSSRSDRPIEFPDKEDGLPDDFARLLFRMSSRLPGKIQAAAKSEGFPVSDSTRGFVFNADLVSVIRFLDIGTKAAHSLRAPMPGNGRVSLRWHDLSVPTRRHAAA